MINYSIKILINKNSSLYHAGKHAAKAPHVQRVIIILKIYKELWAFKISEENEGLEY